MPELIQHDTILELRLDRPPANALQPEDVTAITRALREAPAQGSRAVVLSGRPRMFCGGLDVPLLQKLTRNELTQFWVSFYSMLRALAECRVPLAAAITGHAPAGGTAMAVFCDYRVMAQGDFRLGLNETRVGLPLPTPIHVAYERLIGPRLAARYAAQGQLFDAAHALDIGLVDELAAPDAVVERALHWCRELLALPPLALARTREFGRRQLTAAFAHWQSEAEEMGRVWHSRETQEALARLLERLRK